MGVSPNTVCYCCKDVEELLRGAHIKVIDLSCTARTEQARAIDEPV
jgi:hypothetical protein